jgi:hypothetical protein
MRRELTVNEASAAIDEGRCVTAGGWDFAEVNDCVAFRGHGCNTNWKTLAPTALMAFLAGPRWMEEPDEKPEPELELPLEVSARCPHVDGLATGGQVHLALTALYRALMGEIEKLGVRLNGTCDNAERAIGAWERQHVEYASRLDRIEAELKRLDVPFLNSREGGK